MGGDAPVCWPGDQNVYVDESFSEELRTRSGTVGGFAPACVLAHEVGPHIQHLTGIEADVRGRQQTRAMRFPYVWSSRPIVWPVRGRTRDDERRAIHHEMEDRHV